MCVTLHAVDIRKFYTGTQSNRCTIIVMHVYTISCNEYIIIYTLPPHIHYGHVSIVVVFEFSDTDKDGSEETGVINVRVVQSVATAVPINLSITPTEYSDEFGFDVPDYDPNSPNIATRTYVCFLHIM